MATKEEIQEEIDRILIDGHTLLIPNYTPVGIRDEILAYLHLQGMVFKVERELPKYEDYYPTTTFTARYQQARRAAWAKGQLRMLSDGFTAVGPII